MHVNSSYDTYAISESRACLQQIVWIMDIRLSLYWGSHPKHFLYIAPFPSVEERHWVGRQSFGGKGCQGKGEVCWIWDHPVLAMSETLLKVFLGPALSEKSKNTMFEGEIVHLCRFLSPLPLTAFSRPLADFVQKAPQKSLLLMVTYDDGSSR